MTTAILNSREDIKKLDSKNMLESIELLDAQMKEVREQFATFTLPSDYKQVSKVVFFGMGGSTLGSHVIKALSLKVAKVPFEIVNGYDIPGYVDANTLAIVISYSGTTEEPITAMKAAHAVGAKLVVITSGGEMAEWAKANNAPLINFSVNNNPCNSPRMGGGYMMTAQLMVLEAAELISCSSADLDALAQGVVEAKKMFGVENKNNNLAKDIAAAAQNKSVWYVGAEHLAGNAHIAANQMNENAKRFAGYFLIPELNHHLMEGMQNPATNHEDILFILFESKAYSPKIQKRFSVTKEILKQNKINYFSYESNGSSPYSDIGEFISLSSHASFYTAIAAGIDPTAIPFVDFFKAALKK